MQTGRDLKLRRVAMDVSQSALAEKIGVPVSSVSRWEGARYVTTKAAERYLAALATFGTIPTVDVDRPEAVA
jgi:DNA-binding transcriptional regulator YiaG